MAQKTHEEFIKQMNENNPNIEILGKYISSKTKIECKCRICDHEWEALPNNLTRGSHCPKCSRINRTYYNQKNTQQFIEEMERVNPNIEILGEYTRSKEKIKCKCKICNNIWSPIPNTLLNGSGCPICSVSSRTEKARKTQQQFIEDMSVIHPKVIVLGEYVNNKTKIKCECKECDTIWEAKPNSLLDGEGCPTCGKRIAIEKKTLTNDEFISRLKKINPKYKVLDKYVTCETKIRCQCDICGGIWEAAPIKLLNNRGCPICNGNKCVSGINDIATKRPDLVKYFINQEDATKYTTGSSKRLVLKCPDCGKEKEMAISVLVRSGFSCDNCSDNISYPNKYMRGFLSQLPVENVDYEYSPEWIKPFRYDGYFEYNGQAYIMEMDGSLGHGKFKYGSKEKDTEGIKKDKYKENLAKQHNIKVIRIDCELSESDYISKNIISSELSDIFDLSNINWNKCNEFATKNIVKEVCDYFNKTNLNPSIIAKDLKLGKNTARRYLKRGNELGWCNYVPNGHRTKKEYVPKTDRRKNRMIHVYNKHDVNTILHTFQNSVECAENMSNIYDCNFIPSGIRNVINGYKKTYKGFVFKYAS